MNIAIIQIWSSKRNGKLVVRMLITKRDTEKPIELKRTKSKNVTSLLEPKMDLPAKLPSCQKPPGGVNPTWKVAVATRTDITSSTLRASLGESRSFLNLKYSTKFFGCTREVTEAEGLLTRMLWWSLSLALMAPAPQRISSISLSPALLEKISSKSSS